jgi:hypothetical protein
VIAMTIACAAVLAALVASTPPPSSAVPSFDAFSSAGIVMAQLVPTASDAGRPTVCTEQYAPVCGRLNNVIKTYSNQCYARAAGADVIAQGPCPGAVAPPGQR